MIAAVFSSVRASPMSRGVSHSIMLGLYAGVLISMCVYIGLQTLAARGRLGRFYLVWGPLAVMVIGTCMTIFDLLRHFLLDQNVNPSALHMYNSDGSLTGIGRTGVVLTWVGVSLFVIGTMWFLDYQHKIARFWRSASSWLASMRKKEQAVESTEVGKADPPPAPPPPPPLQA